MVEVLKALLSFLILFAHKISEASQKWIELPMIEEYVEKDQTGKFTVYYIESKNLSLYRIHFENGKAYQGGYKLINHYGLYVMDANGRFYTFPEDISEYENSVNPYPYNLDFGPTKIFHHSSFFAGKPVASAGYLKTDEKGNLVVIDRSSGHYKPVRSYLDQAVLALIQIGAAKNLNVPDEDRMERFSSSELNDKIKALFNNSSSVTLDRFEIEIIYHVENFDKVNYEENVSSLRKLLEAEQMRFDISEKSSNLQIKLIFPKIPVETIWSLKRVWSLKRARSDAYPRSAGLAKVG